MAGFVALIETVEAFTKVAAKVTAPNVAKSNKLFFTLIVILILYVLIIYKLG